MVPGYRLETLLRSGAGGETYRARRSDTGTLCRIRLLPLQGTDKERFLNEARSAALLVHPSVADVYEAGELPSAEAFVVSEEPEGKTLRERLDAVGSPQLLTCIQVARQAAEALHVIHQNGLVHRAMRPENIVLTADIEHSLLVRIKDIDLGGAAERSIVSNKFQIDSAVDILKYFAPEQFSPDGSDARTDVYSIGLVLYEMLAGAPPFEGTKASELIDQIRNRRPAEVAVNDLELRMLVTHTVMGSLNKRPDQRQSTALAFARQLRHIEQLATHVSTPPPVVAAPRPAAASTAPSASLTPAGEVLSIASMPDPAPRQRANETPAAESLNAVTAPVATRKSDEGPNTFESARVIGRGEALSKETTSPPISRMKIRRKTLHATPPVAVPLKELATEERPTSEPPAHVSAAAHPQATRIEWEQPDDIPSLDESRAAKVEQPAEFAASQEILERPGEVPASPAKRNKAAFPRPIERPRALHTLDATLKKERRVSAEWVSVAAVGEATVAAAKSSGAREPVGPRSILPRGRGIWIHPELPSVKEKRVPKPVAPMKAKAAAPVFVPTLLGNSAEADALIDTPVFGSMLSSTDAPPAGRSMARSAGFVVVAVLAAAFIYAFSTDLVGRINSSSASSAAVSAVRASAENDARLEVRSEPATDVPVESEIAESKVAHNPPAAGEPEAVKPSKRIVEELTTPRAKGRPVDEPAPTSAIKAVKAPRAETRPDTSAVKKAKPIEEKRVAKKQAEAKPSAAQSLRSGAVRPRIVKMPQ